MFQKKQMKMNTYKGNKSLLGGRTFKNPKGQSISEVEFDHNLEDSISAELSRDFLVNNEANLYGHIYQGRQRTFEEIFKKYSNDDNISSIIDWKSFRIKEGHSEWRPICHEKDFAGSCTAINTMSLTVIKVLQKSIHLTKKVDKKKVKRSFTKKNAPCIKTSRKLKAAVFSENASMKRRPSFDSIKDYRPQITDDSFSDCSDESSTSTDYDLNETLPIQSLVSKNNLKKFEIPQTVSSTTMLTSKSGRQITLNTFSNTSKYDTMKKHKLQPENKCPSNLTDLKTFGNTKSVSKYIGQNNSGNTNPKVFESLSNYKATYNIFNECKNENNNIKLPLDSNFTVHNLTSVEKKQTTKSKPFHSIQDKYHEPNENKDSKDIGIVSDHFSDFEESCGSLSKVKNTNKTIHDSTFTIVNFTVHSSKDIRLQKPLNQIQEEICKLNEEKSLPSNTKIVKRLIKQPVKKRKLLSENCHEKSSVANKSTFLPLDSLIDILPKVQTVQDTPKNCNDVASESSKSDTFLCLGSKIISPKIKQLNKPKHKKLVLDDSLLDVLSSNFQSLNMPKNNSVAKKPTLLNLDNEIDFSPQVLTLHDTPKHCNNVNSESAKNDTFMYSRITRSKIISPKIKQLNKPKHEKLVLDDSFLDVLSSNFQSWDMPKNNSVAKKPTSLNLDNEIDFSPQVLTLHDTPKRCKNVNSESAKNDIFMYSRNRIISPKIKGVNKPKYKKLTFEESSLNTTSSNFESLKMSLNKSLANKQSLKQFDSPDKACSILNDELSKKVSISNINDNCGSDQLCKSSMWETMDNSTNTSDSNDFKSTRIVENKFPSCPNVSGVWCIENSHKCLNLLETPKSLKNNKFQYRTKRGTHSSEDSVKKISSKVKNSNEMKKASQSAKMNLSEISLDVLSFSPSSQTSFSKVPHSGKKKHTSKKNSAKKFVSLCEIPIDELSSPLLKLSFN